jgi:hypothetical protein
MLVKLGLYLQISVPWTMACISVENLFNENEKREKSQFEVHFHIDHTQMHELLKHA